MYFSLIPSIQYDTKPISYPFSEGDYVVAKNFFRRYKINEDTFSYTVLFRKYAIEDGERLDTLAERAYENAFYDWIIVLTNNLINPSFDWPMSESELRKHVESRYDNPYDTIHHYEIISNAEQIEAFGKVIMPEGTVVDENFYNSVERYVVDTKPEQVFPSVSYDMTSDSPNIFSSSGATIVPSGTGIGTTGGFNIGQHLTIRGPQKPRFVVFNPVNSSQVVRVEVIGTRGDGTNGGETPDIANTEDLKLQYQVGGTNGAWTTIGTMINVDGSNGVSLGGLPAGVNYYFLNLPQDAQQPNTYFRLYQPDNSGSTFDHYGILQVTFKNEIVPDYNTYTIVNSNYHIIDGVTWVNQNGTWKRKVSKGVEYYDEGITKEISGAQISKPVFVFDYEHKENEKKREIYLLKPKYLDAFIDDFRRTNLYKKSSDFINSRLKRTGN